MEEPVIEATGFSFAYPASAEATVGPLDWSVSQGAFQLLVGSTGCGKTTLLRCCKPSLAPAGEQVGSLSVLGRAPADFSVREGAMDVGFVAQNPDTQIVCDTVWHELAFGLENIGMPRDAMRRRIAEVAHFFGIEPWFRCETSALSGGQKQLLNLASVLALRPKLLVLDEPTSQLDPIAEKNFLHALFRVNRELGITVVVATHAPEAMVPYATSCSRLSVSGVEEISLRDLSSPLLPAGKERDRASVPDNTATASQDAIDATVRRPTAEMKDAGVQVDRTPHAVTAPCGIAVRLDDVYVRYARDAEWVLRGFDADLRAGGFHAVVGGNGCGKSTLLRAIARTVKPERGAVENRLLSRQALLPQDPRELFVCDTVREELEEWQRACGYDAAAVDQALERFGLSGAASQHPLDLSGGQQQLLAFAKIDLTDPDLFLLDEPTKGLDAQAKRILADALLTRVDCGATLIVATHDLAFASCVADDVTLMFDGEAASIEPTDSFFADTLFYRPLDDAFSRAWRRR